MATIVWPKHARWYAPLEWYQGLSRLLPEGYVINAGGETIDRSQSAISDFVMGGGVWIDYGGWPMYYRDTPFGPFPLGQDGFMAFLVNSAVPFRHTFNVKLHYPDFPFDRALVVQEPVIPSFITPDRSAPSRDKAFSCFSMKLGQGWYFWACADPSGTGVHYQDYARFIAATTGIPLPPPPVPPSDGTGVPPALILAGALVAGLLLARAVRQA